MIHSTKSSTDFLSKSFVMRESFQQIKGKLKDLHYKVQFTVETVFHNSGHN